MKIHSLSKLLAVILVSMVAGLLYYSWTVSNVYSVWVFLPVSLLVVIYVFQGQIDYYYHLRFPLKFDDKLKDWLTRYFPYYVELSDEEKNKFEYRLGLYISGRSFKSVGSEQRDVPEDIKCMVAAYGIQMTMGLKDFLIGDVDRIFLYKHPFPSPNMPWLHNVETNHEDGVIILSLEQLTNAVLQPKQFYNTAYHAYADALVNNLKINLQDIKDSWEGLEKVAGWSQQQILLQTGHKEIHPVIVHVHFFFFIPSEYQKVFPAQYEKLQTIFRPNPS